MILASQFMKVVFNIMGYKLFRNDINGLRAIAVVCVVLFHFNVNGLQGGFAGVDIFFVISGFLMTGIAIQKVDNKRLLDFYLARIVRIVPSLTILIAVIMIYGFFKLSSSEYETLSKNALSSMLFFSNYYYAAHSSYFDASATTNYLLHTWSLSVEWQFYIIYPLIILLIKFTKKPIFPFIIFLFTASFCISMLGGIGSKDDLFYSLPTRTWEMLAGGLVFLTQKKYEKLRFKYLYSYAGIALIFLSIIFIGKGDSWPSMLTIIPVAGTCLLIISNNQSSFITSNALMQYIGSVSYSLYLWHWPIVAYMYKNRIPFDFINITTGISASVLLGSISYYLIENNFRNKEKIKSLKPLYFTALVIVCFASYTKGLSFRFSDSLREVVEFRMDNSKWRPDTCFLNPKQDYKEFSRCSDQMDSNSIVIWGDSHAAHLMPGIMKELSDKGNIVQRTASLCGPLIGMVKNDRPHCENINANIAAEISEKKPKAVVLSGLWSFYPIKNYLKVTLDYLEKSGIENIYVIGPFPFWKEPLVNIIEKNGISQGGYTSYSFLDNTKHLESDDTFIRSLTGRYANVHYISPMSMLCDTSQCKSIVVSGHKSYPIQYDFAHMSPEGSEFFAKYLSERFK